MEDAHRPAPGSLRKAGFVVVVVFVVFALSELVSFIGLSGINRRWMTPGVVSDFRSQQVGRPIGRDGGDQNEIPYSTQYAVHPYLGYVIDSNFDRSARLESGGEDAVNYGFQLTEPGVFHPVDDDTLVIALTGGSVAFGLSLHFSDELKTMILRSLDGEAEKIVVVNLAMPGYKQPQQLLTLNYLLTLGARFDVVVNLDGFNEIALAPSENLAKSVAPIYPHAWYYRIADFDPESRVIIGQMMIEQQRRHRRAGFFDRQEWKWSSTAGLLWALTDGVSSRRIADLEDRISDLQSTIQPSLTVAGPDRGYTTTKEMIIDLAGVWQNSSRLMNGVCRRSGIDYLHFLQPNQYLADSKPMTDSERRSIINFELSSSVHAELGYPLLRALGRDLRQEGVNFIDLTMLFSSTAEATYGDDCCHYTALGERMVALAMADQIVWALQDN